MKSGKRFKVYLNPGHRLGVILDFENHVFKRFIRYFAHPKNISYIHTRADNLDRGDRVKIPGGSVIVRIR